MAKLSNRGFQQGHLGRHKTLVTVKAVSLLGERSGVDGDVAAPRAMAANSSRRPAAPHWQRASVGRGEGPYACLWIHPSELLPPAFQDVLCRRCRAYAVGLGPRDPSVTQKLTSSQLEHKNCGNANIRPLEEKGANSNWGVWEVNLQNPE